MVEVVREALDYVQQLEALGVLRGNPAKAQSRPQDVAAHRAGGVRVTVVVHGSNDPRLEVVLVPQRTEYGYGQRLLGHPSLAELVDAVEVALGGVGEAQRVHKKALQFLHLFGIRIGFGERVQRTHDGLAHAATWLVRQHAHNHRERSGGQPAQRVAVREGGTLRAKPEGVGIAAAVGAIFRVEVEPCRSHAHHAATALAAVDGALGRSLAPLRAGGEARVPRRALLEELGHADEPRVVVDATPPFVERIPLGLRAVPVSVAVADIAFIRPHNAARHPARGT